MRTVLFLALLLLAGCSSSPNPNFYTLAAMPGPVAHLSAHSIELRRISVAGYLDQPQIVRSSASFSLQLAANDRWGETLGGMLDRVFTEDLVERLPSTAVFEESGPISTSPDLVLEIDVQRFDADANGAVVLLAQVAVRRGDASRAADARTLRVTVPLATTATTREYVAAMSHALASLADQVVGILGGYSSTPAR